MTRTRTMTNRFSYAALLVFFLASTAQATRMPQPFSDNFKIVIDPNASRTKQNARLLSNVQRTTCSSGKDLKKFFEKDVKEMYEQARERTLKLKDRVQTEAEKLYDQAREQLSHYSKAEIGLYTSLACALTFAVQAVFSREISKTLDIGVINYILSGAVFDRYQTIKELKKPKRSFKIYTSPSVFSDDGKTYVRLVKKSMAKKSTSRGVQEAQIQVHASSFYQNMKERVDPASHNAVLKTMTPYMRHKLKARRMRGGAVSRGLLERLKVGFYFFAWYALNVVYNIINKKVLNVLPAPLIVGTFQFGIGALYCALVWLSGFRAMPKLTPEGRSAVNSVGLYHALGQLASMISLGAGPVSFTHIVKAMEPFFSAVVSGFYFKKWMKPQVYLTLIPVVCGVGYACMKELNFSWLSFGAAMSSNLFFALRAVMSKLALQSGESAGTNLTPPNMFGMVTVTAFLISIPMALLREGKVFSGLWKTALNTVENQNHFFRSLVVSGLVHYLNNEVMYLALGCVHPVTLAVGNTMKRVFILIASVMVFRNPITVQAGIGSGVGIAGVLLYSLTKQYYESVEASQAAAAPVKKRWRKA